MYLVTGGAGFIGSHLCETLLARGSSVRVLDNFSTGRRENLPPQVEVVAGSVTDACLVRQALEGVTGCFHLAAIASVEEGVKDWIGTHRTNLTGTITLFDAVSRMREKPPVIYASSAAVYGNAMPPIREDTPKRPLSAYGADKLGCELHAAVASNTHGIATVGLRFFNVYGPRQDGNSPYSGVISIFCDKLRQGQPIIIFGDGKQTRDFVYVSDVVAAMLAAMLRPAQGSIFNVCSGTATSVLQLGHTIGDLLGRRPDIHYLPARSGDIRDLVGSPTKIRHAFDLSDPAPLDIGLARVLDWLNV